MRFSAATIRVARRLDHVLALPGGGVRTELQRLVDDAEVVLIVQKPGVGADFGIDADPEVHIPVERGRLRK